MSARIPDTDPKPTTATMSTTIIMFGIDRTMVKATRIPPYDKGCLFNVDDEKKVAEKQGQRPVSC